MSSIEIEAKTKKEAVIKACNHFQLSEEDLNIEVLEDRSTGIFGIVGNRRVKIKASPVDDGPVAIARQTLEKITSLISGDTKVSAKKKGDNIWLNIQGNNPRILIGHKGKMLEALQIIVNKAVNKSSDKSIRVVVDAENYRQKREESLKRLALRLSEKAKKTKRKVSTNPINPHERRVIHLALRDDRQIQTKSQGSGIYKKVLVMPSQNSEKEPVDE